MSVLHRVLLTACWLLAAGCAQKVADERIWVGHLAPLSGAEKALGEHERQGILLAVEEANHGDRRILGRRVAVQHVDDRGDPSVVQAEAVRLIAVNRVFGLLGGTAPPEAERLARTAQANAVPAVLLGPLPASAGREGVASLTASPTRQGQVLGRFVRQKLESTRAGAIVSGRSSVYTDLSAAFRREFSREGAEEWVYEAEGDFPDLLKRLKKATPEVLLIAAPARDFLRLAALVREAELKTTLLYGGPEGELPLLLADRATAEGVYAATTYLAEADTAVNREFVKNYQDHFHEPPDVAAALAYDGARLLFQALRQMRFLDPAEARRELTLIDKFESLTGPVTFGKDPHAVRPLFVAQVEKGRLKQAERYEPDGK